MTRERVCRKRWSEYNAQRALCTAARPSDKVMVLFDLHVHAPCTHTPIANTFACVLSLFCMDRWHLAGKIKLNTYCFLVVLGMVACLVNIAQVWGMRFCGNVVTWP